MWKVDKKRGGWLSFHSTHLSFICVCVCVFVTKNSCSTACSILFIPKYQNYITRILLTFTQMFLSAKDIQLKPNCLTVTQIFIHPKTLSHTDVCSASAETPLHNAPQRSTTLHNATDFLFHSFRIRVCVCVCARLCVFVSVCVHVYVCVFVSVSMRACVCGRL